MFVPNGHAEISIHAPRTGSDPPICYNISRRKGISIHAPRTGSDGFPASPAILTHSNFNPRSPHGERLWTSFRASPQCTISIHAPRTGSDEVFTVKSQDIKTFQSTLPARGATCQKGCNKNDATFQSTLPARGATTVRRFFCATTRFQSTLPARGATVDCAGEAGRTADFNPRSPHGERRCRLSPPTLAT